MGKKLEECIKNFSSAQKSIIATALSGNIINKIEDSYGVVKGSDDCLSIEELLYLLYIQANNLRNLTDNNTQGDYICRLQDLIVCFKCFSEADSKQGSKHLIPEASYQEIFKARSLRRMFMAISYIYSNTASKKFKEKYSNSVKKEYQRMGENAYQIFIKLKGKVSIYRLNAVMEEADKINVFQIVGNFEDFKNRLALYYLFDGKIKDCNTKAKTLHEANMLPKYCTCTEKLLEFNSRAMMTNFRVIRSAMEFKKPKHFINNAVQDMIICYRIYCYLSAVYLAELEFTDKKLANIMKKDHMPFICYEALKKEKDPKKIWWELISVITNVLPAAYSLDISDLNTVEGFDTGIIHASNLFKKADAINITAKIKRMIKTVIEQVSLQSRIL